MEFTEQYISLSDLKKVSGIGDKTIERIKFQIDKINESKNILEDVLQIQPPCNLKVPLNDVYCGESIEFMRKNIPDKSIDMILTSPPYDNLRDYNGYDFDYKTMLGEIYRALKDGGTCVWVVGDETVEGSETLTSFKQALYAKSLGLNVETMIWEKQTFTATGALKYRYGQVFEYMFVFTKGKVKVFNPIMDRKNKSFGRSKTGTIRQVDGSTTPISSIGKSIKEYGQRFNVWTINTEMSNKNRLHPAPFPEQLAQDHILSWTNEGDIVLDPMCGSGTTCKMAKLNNRNFIGVDISEEYVNISKERILK